MATDFESKYLALRDENTALKKKKNEQEATIKRMFTKLAMIEESMKKKHINEDHDNQEEAETGGKTISLKRDLEVEKYIQTLKIENTQLRKKNQVLLEKNRVMEEKIRQHQVRYHNNARVTSKLKKGGESSTPKASSGKMHHLSDSGTKQKRENVSGDLEMALKHRLVVAEKQLVRLQQENEQFRKRSGLKSTNNTHNDGQNEDMDAKAAMSLDIEHLQRELRDRQAQVSILNARYENLEANASAEREIQEKTLEQLENMNRQVHRLRTQLQNTSLEKEELEIRVAKANEVERELVLLRDQNRRLEERMTSLCESPFINDAFQRKERIDKMFELEKQTQQQKTALTHMTEENQKLQMIVKELQNNIKLMKQAKDMVEQDMEKLRQQLLEERHSRSFQMSINTTMETPRVPSPHPRQQTVIPAALPQPERRDASSSPLKGTQQVPFTPIVHNGAQAVVRRKYSDLMLGESTNIGDSDINYDVKHLRNRVHVLQIAHLKAIQELERCEKMLHAQTNINRELAEEVEELTTKKVSTTITLQKRMKDLELIAEERQERIQQLEAQIRQLKYAREKLRRATDDRSDLIDGDMTDESDDDVASISESLILATRDLSPGEQLVEIWIIGADFDRSIITGNTSTFVLCDFYDFESQSTPLLLGTRPEYNFSSTFKVTVDAFFLRYLASETLTLELHQAVRGDFRLIGRGSIRLSHLLKSKGVIKERALPCKLLYNETSGSHSNKLVGTLNVVVRMAAPISEIWKLHLRSYPQDVQLLTHSEPLKLTDAIEDYLEGDNNDNGRRLVNELQITIFACRHLRSYGRKEGNYSTTPSSYVHYQLLGFPDMFTNIVPTTSNPEYELATSQQCLSLEVDASLLRFFSKFKLWFTVFDDQVQVHESNNSSDINDGVIGRCGIMLDELVKGECVRGWFPLVDRHDQPAGEISIVIEWKDAFQVAQLHSWLRTGGNITEGGIRDRRVMDLHYLDYDQQHSIMSMFSPQMDGRINYRQFLQYSFPSEALELVTSKIKERLEYALDTQQLVSIRDLFMPEQHDPASKQQKEGEIRLQIDMFTLQKILERFGVHLTDDEVVTIEHAFCERQASDLTQRKSESETGDPSKLIVHYIILHLTPRLSCAARLLLHKVRQTMRAFLKDQKYLHQQRASHMEATTTKTLFSPSAPFEKYDVGKSGFVSRAEFKRCLSVLGFELLNIDKEYKDFIARETSACLQATETTETNRIQGTVGTVQNLDEEVLDHRTTQREENDDELTRIPELRTETATNSVEQIPTGKVEPPHQPITKPSTIPNHSAVSEFERRKQVFRDRIKQIASNSSRSLVYEQLEKQKEGKPQISLPLSLPSQPSQTISAQNDAIVSQLKSLQIPQALHHDAARILQKQYRRFRAQQAGIGVQQKMALTMAGIVYMDRQLERTFKTCTAKELDSMKDQVIEIIENEFPGARKQKAITRKQFSFILSKVPRLTLDPTVLRNLIDYFSVRKDEVAYHKLMHFICTVSTDSRVKECTPIPLLKTIRELYIDVKHAQQTFISVGDMNNSGRITIKRFRDVVQRLDLRLSVQDLRILMSLLDFNGVDVLYIPLLHLLRESPASVELHTVVSRCTRFGINRLRDNLLLMIKGTVNDTVDDGTFTREELHSVLMKENTDVVKFEPRDSYVLCDIITKTNMSPNLYQKQGVAPKLSIYALTTILEHFAKSSETILSEESLNVYTLQQLQRLAWNSRKLGLCPPYTELLANFERIDWRESGIVSLAEFVYIVPKIGFVLFTEPQIKLIARHFGAKIKNGFGINYRQFLDWSTPGLTYEIEDIEAKLRKFATSQANSSMNAVSQQGIQVTQVLTAWRQAFAAADRNASGTLARGDFAIVCMEKLQLPLDPEELRVLLYSYDRNLEDTVDYGAFVQLNWKETSKATAIERKRVKFGEASSDTGAKLDELIERMRENLRKNKISDRQATQAIASFATPLPNLGALVDQSKLILCMKQLGVVLSPDEGRCLLAVYGSKENDRATLNINHFLKNILGLDAQPAIEPQTLTNSDEAQLATTIASAIKYSNKDMERALEQFEEFCVVYEFGEILSHKVWKHMERIGLVTLLSKKGVGLLLQKFSASHGDHSDDDEDIKHSGRALISLRAVHEYLTQQKKSNAMSPMNNQRGTEHVFELAIECVKRLMTSMATKSTDLRSMFENSDVDYTGYVPALEMKKVLIEAGIGQFVTNSLIKIGVDGVIGLLVRNFRKHEVDAVCYHKLLRQAMFTGINDLDERNVWFNSMSEHLRTRIRLKAGLRGSILFNGKDNVTSVCRSLDLTFSHFDRSKRGFLVHDDVHQGLAALKYDLPPDHTDFFIKSVGVFRHGNGGLSRMEFDAFVIDPFASHLLELFATQLFSCTTTTPSVPLIAELSRLFLKHDQPLNQGVLPLHVVWECLEAVTPRPLGERVQQRLQILFDVNRDGMFAYKLFLKVMSQHHQPPPQQLHAPDVSPHHNEQLQHDGLSARSRYDLLRSLYNQLSSVDFESQVDILEEYLRRRDTRGMGYVKLRYFKQIIQQIGLSLSQDAYLHLENHFGKTKRRNDKNQSDILIHYQELVEAIKEMEEVEQQKTE